MFLSCMFQSTLATSQSVMFLSYVFQNTLMTFMIYIKIIQIEEFLLSDYQYHLL